MLNAENGIADDGVLIADSVRYVGTDFGSAPPIDWERAHTLD